MPRIGSLSGPLHSEPSPSLAARQVTVSPGRLRAPTLCLTLPPASLGQQQSLCVQVSKAETLLGLSLIDSEGDSASQEPRRALQGPLTSVRRHAKGTMAADKYQHLHPPRASHSISAQADSPKEMDSPCCWVPVTEATASPRTIANRPCATVHGARVSLAKGKSASCLHCFLTV